MKEEIVRIAEGHELLNTPCGACGTPLAAGDEAVVCPRCKQAHHLACWIHRGGCARHGCRQVISPELRPPKAEQPITVKRTPPWMIAAAVVLVVALAAGLYANGRRAARERESSAYVLVPSFEDVVLWERILDAYNATPAGTANPARLIVTPYGPGGTDFEQKLLVMIAANDAPELVVLEADRVRAYAAGGALAPVDEELRALTRRGAEVDAEMLQAATHEGALYGIPHPRRDAFLVIPREPRNPDAAASLFPFVAAALYGVGDDASQPAGNE